MPQITKEDVMEMRQVLDKMDIGTYGSQQRKDFIEAHQKYMDTVSKTGHVITQSDLDKANKDIKSGFSYFFDSIIGK